MKTAVWRWKPANSLSRSFAHRESQTHGFHMQICHDDNTVTSIIPGVVLPILLDVLTQIAQGTSVVVNHLPVTLTIEQAADFLNVSTSYVESLVSHHEIPIRVVGKHRQILRADLVTYKKQSDAKRQAVLDELSALGQEMAKVFNRGIHRPVRCQRPLLGFLTRSALESSQDGYISCSIRQKRLMTSG